MPDHGLADCLCFLAGSGWVLPDITRHPQTGGGTGGSSSAAAARVEAQISPWCVLALTCGLDRVTV
jgi:hypothetical protein